MKPIENETQYRKALAGHDWWYMYADDNSVYNKGKAVSNALFEAKKKFDPSGAIWNEFAPAEMKARA